MECNYQKNSHVHCSSDEYCCRMDIIYCIHVVIVLDSISCCPNYVLLTTAVYSRATLLQRYWATPGCLSSMASRSGVPQTL